MESTFSQIVVSYGLSPDGQRSEILISDRSLDHGRSSRCAIASHSGITGCESKVCVSLCARLQTVSHENGCCLRQLSGDRDEGSLVALIACVCLVSSKTSDHSIYAISFLSLLLRSPVFPCLFARAVLQCLSSNCKQRRQRSVSDCGRL